MGKVGAIRGGVLLACIATALSVVPAATGKKHKKIFLGVVAKVVESGTLTYTGDDAFKADSGCVKDDGTDQLFPTEDHHEATLNWRASFSHVKLGAIAPGAHGLQTVTTTTTLTNSSYRLRGFGYILTGICPPQKVTYKCQGQFTAPGRDNAILEVINGEELDLYTLEALKARPATCLNSNHDVEGTIDTFLQYWGPNGGDSSTTDSLVDRAGQFVPTITLPWHTVRNLPSNRTIERRYTGGDDNKVPENCSTPDGPGETGDQCSQDFHAKVTVAISSVKSIYGYPSQ